MLDLRTQKTYKSLCNAFLELLEQKRFEDISIQQLCDVAQIRRATFYTHFADKYEFLSFFIQETRKEFLKHFPSSALDFEKDSRSYYLNLFEELIHFFNSHPGIIKNIKNSQTLPTLIDIFTEEIQQNIFTYLQSKDNKNETYHRMKAHFYAGGILQMLRLWMYNPDQIDINLIDWLD